MIDTRAEATIEMLKAVVVALPECEKLAQCPSPTENASTTSPTIPAYFAIVATPMTRDAYLTPR